MELHLKGKVAIITGGASGLGRCTAEYMKREGVSLVLADFDRERLEQAAHELSSGGARVHCVPTDVRDYASCEALVKAAIDCFGTVDILVNSAGIGGPMSFFAESGPRDWRDLVEINLVGVMNCCRAVLDHMIERRYGKIVSLASEAGKANEKRMVVYGATKGGVISLTRGLAVEWASRGVRVNAIAPSWFETSLGGLIHKEPEYAARAMRRVPVGRMGQPDELIGSVVYLASAASAMVTGHVLNVDGGTLAS